MQDFCVGEGGGHVKNLEKTDRNLVVCIFVTFLQVGQVFLSGVQYPPLFAPS